MITPIVYLVLADYPAAPTRTGGRMTRTTGLDLTRIGGRTQTRIAGRVTRMTGRMNQNMHCPPRFS